LIVALKPEQAEAEISQLSDLLMDAVEGGASVGFLPPLSRAEADAYWHTVITRKGGEAHSMCQALGYTPFGEVPGYARSADGQLHTTVFFYKQLGHI